MKKMMLMGVVAVAMVFGVFMVVEANAGESCCGAAAKKQAAVCEACAKLAKDAKPGEQPKLCDACAKKCEAAKKAEVKTDTKAPEAKK